MHTRSLVWIGGEHDFALDLGSLRALQSACDAGPEQVLRRVSNGTWRVDDLYETLRLGLIGSGAMTEGEARDRLTVLFSQHGLIHFKMTAQTILSAALIGVEDDPLGEPTGAETPPADGSSAASTETAP